ncbi:transglycosylase domain-containing protein [Humibacillus sp. DSM 29435]|uniref:penicillin-binding protein n=1 Tax=Humibacillus sp. DSM 29435 TaxID=1869167 RepID=UPI000A728B59|nr:transglycosylase domain-containing protein [Humibacillus sp. DSM 29435]
MSSRTTSFGGVISLLGAFLASALVLGLLAAGLVMPAVGATGALARSGVDVFNDLPSEFKTDPLAQQSRILAADGTVIATPQDQNRTIVPLKSIAPIMRVAQVDIEDHRFYDHGGVDLQGVVRALVSNIRTGATQSGASSLTQQFVKISLQYSALSNGNKDAAAAAVRKDYMRKIKELKYAITLEKKMTKDQILEGYMNLVYYGDRAYGVEAASQHYFSIPASKLSISQAALLAGLTQNPGTTDPVNNPKRAVERRNVVLDRMHELGSITTKEWKAAKARTLKKDMKVSYPKSTCLSSPYPYWCDFIINYALQMPALGKTAEERRRTLYEGGITITTTLDPRVQKLTQEAVVKQVPIGDKSKVGAAAYVTEPGTGKVLAFAQNTKYTVDKQKLGATGINWALDKKYGGSGGFQFGSTAKAFALVTAMESGLNTKSSVDAKAAGGSSQAAYKPSDFPKDACSKTFRDWRVYNDTSFKGGKMTLMEATALSTNTAFVGLAQQVGLCKIRDTMNRIGMHRADGSPIPEFPAAIVLGGTEVSPQAIANSYATIASDGKRCPVVAVTKITKAGKDIALPPNKCDQVIEPDVARATDKFLEYNMTDGSGRRNQLDSGRESAGKTGTSNRNNESWFAGYTPNLSVAVWVGTPDDGNKRNMVNLTIGGRFIPKMHGAAVAAPIWKAVMDGTLKGQPKESFTEPSDKLLNGDNIDIPSVTGLTVSEAIAELRGAGFSAGVGGTRPSSVPLGLVAGTSPSGKAKTGSYVTIYTSGYAAPPQNANNNATKPPVAPPAVTKTPKPPKATKPPKPVKPPKVTKPPKPVKPPKTTRPPKKT